MGKDDRRGEWEVETYMTCARRGEREKDARKGEGEKPMRKGKGFNACESERQRARATRTRKDSRRKGLEKRTDEREKDKRCVEG